MIRVRREALKPFASKYVWWKTPDEAMVSAGVSLSRGLASARLLFGPSYQPSESLKACTSMTAASMRSALPKEAHLSMQ